MPRCMTCWKSLKGEPVFFVGGIGSMCREHFMELFKWVKSHPVIFSTLYDQALKMKGETNGRLQSDNGESQEGQGHGEPDA